MVYSSHLNEAYSFIRKTAMRAVRGDTLAARAWFVRRRNPVVVLQTSQMDLDTSALC
jgi:hypothetical protein